MPPYTQPKVELQPLLDAIGADTQTRAAEMLDRNLRLVVRWLREGIPLLSAEQLAEEQRIHPTLVWGPDFLERVVDYVEQTEERRQASYERKLRMNAERARRSYRAKRADSRLSTGVDR